MTTLISSMTGAFYLNVSADTASRTSNGNSTQLFDPFKSSMSESWDNVFAVILTFIIATGFTLNTVVIVTLLRNQNRKQAAMDYFILALATSDVMVVCTAYPMTLVSIVSHRWLFGHAGCVLNGFLGFIFSLVDIGILSSMSVVRLLMVKLPYCAMIKRKSCTAALIVSAWSYSLVWTTAPVLGWGEFVPEPFGTSCTVNWKLPDKSYVTCIFFAVLVVPTSMMVISYCSVVTHMRRNADRVDRYFTERRLRAKRQNRLIKMTIMMCACFILTWTPYAVVSICSAYIPSFDLNAVQSAIPTVLAKASHVFNPIVYFSTNANYKTRLKMFWHRKVNSSRATDTRTARATMMTDQADNSNQSVSVSSQCIGMTSAVSASYIQLNYNAGSKCLSLEDVDAANRNHLLLLNNDVNGSKMLSDSDTGDVFI